MMKLNTIKIAYKEALKRGYICIANLQNKDNKAWTMPKDPIIIKVEKLDEMGNLFSEELYTHEQE